MNTKIFFIDNQDSFTYNLVEELYALDIDTEVYRNTVDAQFIIEQIEQAKNQGQSPLLFLSPGPGKPSDSQCMTRLLKHCVGRFPIVGVCLGHQAIAEYFGAKVVLAGETIHGKSSPIQFTAHPIFDGMTSPISVARYHSLKVADLPANLSVIGEYQSMPMVIEDKQNRIVGFQYHPESILTTQGSLMLANTISYLTN